MQAATRGLVMTRSYDAIVIGAGHNGLAAAITLAKSGQQVLLLERAADVGGALALHEFADGYRLPAYSGYFANLGNRALKDLGIELAWEIEDLGSVVLGGPADLRYSATGVSGVSTEDEQRYTEFMELGLSLAAFLDGVMRREAPRLKPPSVREATALAGLGLRLRRLGRADMREFLRIIGQNMFDELESRFDDVYLKGALGFDATLGTHTAPRSPGNCLTWLHRLAGRQGQLAVPVGGVTALAAALEEKARALSVEIRTDAAVERIVVENGRVTGVQVHGERFDSFRVLSSLGAKTTMLGLVGAEHFETDALRRVRHVRARGNVARLQLALDGLPDLPGGGSARYVIAGRLAEVERAFNPVKYGALSQDLTCEFTLPSVTTPGLAPAGKHVLAANLQFVPYAMQDGWTEEARAILLDRAIHCLAAKVPGLAGRIVHSEVLTPADLESRYGLEGGHWHQAELSLDQFLFVRPFVGAAQHQLPLEGLYLCGAAAHPGGGISTLPGQLAARSMLKRGAAR